MKELIKLTQQTLDNIEVNTVNARELHEFLEVRTKFSTWVSNRIDKYEFVENTDFIAISKNLENGGRLIEYHISLDMAKELCMVENNEKGREARRYFIECEKQQADALKALANVTLDLSDTHVVFKNNDFYTSSLSIAKITGKRHDNVLRDIENEVNLLKSEEVNQLKSEPIENREPLDAIINGVKEVSYIDSKGRVQKAYDLSEEATYQMLLRYSPVIRALFIHKFKQMKDAVLNMYKLKVLDSVLPEHKGKRQYVYIIKNLDTGNVKVGVGVNPLKRLEQLQTGSDSELSLVYTSFLCSNAFSVEKEVHKHFKDKHVRGEWFKVSEKEVINYLEQSKYSLSSNLDFSFDTKLKNLIKDGYDRNI